MNTFFDAENRIRIHLHRCWTKMSQIYNTRGKKAHTNFTSCLNEINWIIVVLNRFFLWIFPSNSNCSFAQCLSKMFHVFISLYCCDSERWLSNGEISYTNLGALFFGTQKITKTKCWNVYTTKLSFGSFIKLKLTRTTIFSTKNSFDLIELHFDYKNILMFLEIKNKFCSFKILYLFAFVRSNMALHE